MKKNLCLFLLTLFICGGSAMAGNRLARDGYVGNISLSVTPQMGLGVDITTSHGYSFGNGLWMGAGAGVSLMGACDGFFIPIYTEAKYSFMKDEKASPFLDCKFGVMTNTESTYRLFSPAAGVDINRFSIYALYNMWSQVRTFNIGVAFNF